MANVGISVFTALKISLESLKSQGNLTFSTIGNPDEYLVRIYPKLSCSFSKQLDGCFFSGIVIVGVLCLQFASVEVVITSLYDHFGDFIDRYLKRREILVLCVCIVAFLLSLPNIFQVNIC